MFRKVVKLHQLRRILLGYSRQSNAKYRLSTCQPINSNLIFNLTQQNQSLSFSTNRIPLRLSDKSNEINCSETPQLNEDDIINQDSELRSFLDDIMKDFDSQVPQPPKPPGSKAALVKSEELITSGNAPEQNDTTFTQEVEEPSKTDMSDPDKNYFPKQIVTNGAFRREAFSLDFLVDLLREENLKDIVVINVPQQMSYCDYMIVATAISYRHLNAVADHLRKVHKTIKSRKENYLTIEGQDCKDWKVIDMGNIVLHLFTYEVRDHYDIETLWTVGEQYDDLSNQPTDELETLLNENSYFINTGEAVAVKNS